LESSDEVVADEQFFTTVVIDALLTLAIGYGLWKSKTGWKHTDALIKRIIMSVIPSFPHCTAETMLMRV
jgi:hypothetical protein